MYIMKKIKELGLLVVIARVIKSIGIRLETNIKKRRYSSVKTDFTINVDDDTFEMSFKDNKIGKTIQERIEGVREPETTSIIKAMLKPGDKVLELGGCYGYFTMLMANAVTPSGKVVSIEGLPKNFQCLKDNIKLNKYEHVDCYNYFIGNDGAKIEFEASDGSPYRGITNYKKNSSNNPKTGDSISLYKKYEQNSNNPKTRDIISVDCINIPEFLKQINFEPTHIFGDIEGFEVDTIEQLCEQYLETKSPTLVFEHHEMFYTEGRGIKYIRELLTSKGYIFRKVYGNLIAFRSK